MAQISRFAKMLGRWLNLPGGRIMLALVLLIFAINLIAIGGIIFSSQEAREAAIRDLQLQATACARGVEALLSSTRADILFLAQSPPIAKLEDALGEPDPMARRWRRLEIEATLLLFLDSHAEVERIALLSSAGVPVLTAGRREGAPVVLQAGESIRSMLGQERFFQGRWPVGGADPEGSIEALLSIPSLLEKAAPTQGLALVRELDSFEPNTRAPAGSEENPIKVQVQDLDWDPPINWNIVGIDYRKGLIDSIEKSAKWYRTILLVNLVVMVLACVLGVISIHQVRRSAALEVANRQQTEIRELEKQLAEGERLASVGRLAAGLAHEINNPLEGMSNYLELLEAEIRQQGPESASRLIHKIREGLRRTASITRQVLTFSEPGQAPETAVDIREVLTDTVEFVRGNQLFSGISIGLRGDDQPIQVRGTAVSLGQVFLNLLLNAAEFQQGQGQVDINCWAHNGKVQITFEDRGPGIPEHLLTRVFEPFYSSRNSSGLGLAICLGILNQHGGGIEVANRPDGGARFTVELPILRVEGRPRPEEKQTHAARAT